MNIIQEQQRSLDQTPALDLKALPTVQVLSTQAAPISQVTLPVVQPTPTKSGKWSGTTYQIPQVALPVVQPAPPITPPALTPVLPSPSQSQPLKAVPSTGSPVPQVPGIDALYYADTISKMSDESAAETARVLADTTRVVLPKPIPAQVNPTNLFEPQIPYSRWDVIDWKLVILILILILIAFRSTTR